jgi:DNA-binding transcriptional MerR regulator
VTAGLLDLSDLAARSGVPVERLRRYAETGLLAPARRDGDRFGYPQAEVGVTRMLAGAEALGLGGDTLTGLAGAWRDEDCATARRRLASAVAARLDLVQGDIARRQRLMAGADPTIGEWAEVTKASTPLFEDAARLQAVAEALTRDAHADGPCGDSCGCTAALAAPVTAYHFPSDPAAGEAALLCDLAADGGDARDRIDAWQRVLARVQRRDPLREPLPDPNGASTGVVLRFGFDVDLAATLGRLAAAEYRCCSFGSYTIVVDGTGLRLEVRMPVEAAEAMAAVVGVPDPPTPVAEAPGAADQP